MLRTADVADFLRDGGVTAEIDTGGRFPDEPDVLVSLWQGGGASSTYEREFDRPSLSVRVRGNQADPGSAEDLAAQVDAILMGAERPQIGGRYVTWIDYLGGPPAFLAYDEAQRTILACSYVLEIARE